MVVEKESFQASGLFSVEGKVAFVTGGSRGIGLMIAQGLIANGAKVYISARKAEACEAAAAALSQWGECVAIPADLATEEGRNQVIETISSQEDRLNILVNNAGAAWGAPFEEYPEVGYDKIMDINVKAPFRLMQGFLPLLEKAATPQDPARIINIGSIDGLRVPKVNNFAYGPSKAAIHHLTHVMAVELGRRYVTVNAIAPGAFESKMTEWMLDNMHDQIVARVPLGRIGNPHDMAGLALFLCSQAGAYMNGAVIPLDGGTHLS